MGRALTVGLLAVLALVGRPVMAWLTRDYDRGETLDPKLAIMLMLALAVALAADRIGISALVGGFLFGLVVPHREGMAEAAIERLEDSVVLFFLPVFLAVSGLRTDLKLLKPALIPGLLLFLLLMVVGKWGVGYLAGRAVGLSGSEANTVGVLLNCRGLLILVVGLIGRELNVITPSTQAVFVVGAIVTTLMTGPLVDISLRRAAVPTEETRRISGSARIGR